jgi:hypothetical protein
LLGADSVTGPYAIESNAIVNMEARTITVPLPNATRFYVLRGSSAVTIRTLGIQGANLVFTYQ